MTVNKQQKAKITIEQLFICTSIKLQSLGDFFFHTTQRMEEWRGKVRKNIRSGKPVQNIINVNIWVGIYIDISYSHIFIWNHSHTYQYTKNLKCNFSPSHRCGHNYSFLLTTHYQSRYHQSFNLNLRARGPCGFVYVCFSRGWGFLWVKYSHWLINDKFFKKARFLEDLSEVDRLWNAL